MMRPSNWTSLAAGIAGAVALNLLHETTRHLVDDAPRMDVLGERSIQKIMSLAGHAPPPEDSLYAATMIGDLVTNSTYYAMVGTGKSAWWRGAVLGLLAGVGGVVLPPVMGLGSDPSGRSNRTKVMTVLYYLTGGLVAAAVSRLITTSSPTNTDAGSTPARALPAATFAI